MLVKQSRFWSLPVFRRLKRLLKQVLTVNFQVSFWCDGHVWVCYCCHGFRDWLKYGVFPRNKVVLTKSGRLFVFGEASWLTLNRKIGG